MSTVVASSNNTNKFNPQEPQTIESFFSICSNNTNKFNPQEPRVLKDIPGLVQIIQINSILKNYHNIVVYAHMFK